MTTSELKQQIDKVLGNSIRCLLPSYWWKRLFHQVADRIDEVEQSVESKADKSYVDEAVGNVKVDITIDSELSDTSTNPVQNKVIKTAIDSVAPVFLIYKTSGFSQFWAAIYGATSNNYPRGVVVLDDANIEIDGVRAVDDTNIAIEFNYNGGLYKWIFNKNTGDFVSEEVISSAGSDEVATVPIVNSEEELLSYNSEEIAAAKILELTSVRDWVEGETVIKHLSFAPTLEPTMSAPSSDISFTVINKEHTAGVAIVVYESGYIGAQLVVDGGTASRVQLYENGVLITESVQEVNNVLAENDCVFYTVTSKSEETYALLDLLVKLSNDKGLVNYVNGEIKYLATKDDVIANEKAIKELQTTVNATVESLADYATVESLEGAVNSINDNIVANEQVTASALNDLNSRINEILTRLTEAGI